MAILNAGLIIVPGFSSYNPGFLTNEWFDVNFQLQTGRLITSTSATFFTAKDSIFSLTTGATFAADWVAFPIIYPRKTIPSINYSISLGGSLTQDSNNLNLFKSQVAGGKETITISSSQRSISQELPSLIYKSSGDTTVFTDYTTDSLAKHISTNIDNRLVGKSPYVNKSIFLGDASAPYTRNSNFWIADLVAELTGITPYNSSSGHLGGASPLTKRHLVYPAHISFPLGTVFNFVNLDGSYIQKTLIQSKISPSYSTSNGYYTDFVIGLLDSDLPSWVTVYPLLPSNWRNYLPSLNNRIPVFNTDYSEYMEVRDWISGSTNGFANFSIPINTKRVEFYHEVLSGYSGNPVFTIIDNKLVLISEFTFGGGGSGVNLADFRLELNQLIADVDLMTGINTGYTVQTVDLSGFPSY